MSVSVLDASVAVSALRASDVNHARAASHLAPLLQGIDSIVIPSIFDVEVVSTLVRAGVAPVEARRAADLFLARARVVTLWSSWGAHCVGCGLEDAARDRGRDLCLGRRTRGIAACDVRRGDSLARAPCRRHGGVPALKTVEAGKLGSSA